MLLAKLHVAFCQLGVGHLALDALCLVLIRVFWVLVEGLFSIAVDANPEDVSLLPRLAFRLY